MYQYSLGWFKGLFEVGIDKSAPSSELVVRIGNLQATMTEILYLNVCRSLFEKHKLMFSFLLTIAIMKGDGKIDADEWRFLISGLGPSSTAAAASGDEEGGGDEERTETGEDNEGEGAANSKAATHPEDAANPAGGEDGWLNERSWRELQALSRIP